MTASATPSSFRASVLHEPERLVIEERAWRIPAARDVVVRVESVGVCGSDVHYFREGRIGSYVVESPLILGHESSGIVVAVGEGVDSLRVGDRVAIEPGVPCAACEQCRRGRYNLCPEVAFFATPPVDGAFQEYVTIAAAFAHPVPDSISFDAAAMVEPLAVAVWACQKARVGLGSRVLVTGAGPVGLLVTQVARAAGAAEVVVTDTSEERLGLARELGATRAVKAGHEPVADLDVDVLVECSGNSAAARDALFSLSRAGTAVLVGMASSGDLSLPVSLIQERELWVTGIFRYAHAYPAAIALLTGGAVDVESLVTSHHGLDDVAGALEAGRKPGGVKAIVHPTQ